MHRRTSRDSTYFCPNLVIGKLQCRELVPSEFTSTPDTSDYRFDTCDGPVAEIATRHSPDENSMIKSDCSALNCHSHNNNYANFDDKSRVNRVQCDFGIPVATLHGGIRKYSPNRRGLLRLAFNHMLNGPASVKAKLVATIRDFLATRHKKNRSPTRSR